MDTQQELQVQQKREVESKQEATIPARVFVPATDIFETDEALTVILEMPGVDKDKVDVKVENDVLKIEGWIDFSRYEGLQPVYTEYNIGNYARSFQLSSKIDQSTKGGWSIRAPDLPDYWRNQSTYCDRASGRCCMTYCGSTGGRPATRRGRRLNASA